MFISQVIFESEIENKEIIKKMMDKKRGNIKTAAGLITSECWWKENTKTAGFSLISKWNDKESFKVWMKETHKDGHKKPEGLDGKEIKISKTAHQYELVE